LLFTDKPNVSIAAILIALQRKKTPNHPFVHLNYYLSFVTYHTFTPNIWTMNNVIKYKYYTFILPGFYTYLKLIFFGLFVKRRYYRYMLNFNGCNNNTYSDQTLSIIVVQMYNVPIQKINIWVFQPTDFNFRSAWLDFGWEMSQTKRHYNMNFKTQNAACRGMTCLKMTIFYLHYTQIGFCYVWIQWSYLKLFGKAILIIRVPK